MFENLAASMTHSLRSTGIKDQSSNPQYTITIEGASLANGTATSAEILVLMRWPWLVFPAFLLLIALAFFT